MLVLNSFEILKHFCPSRLFGYDFKSVLTYFKRNTDIFKTGYFLENIHKVAKSHTLL